MEEESKIYLRKRLPKLKLALTIVVLFGIAIIVYTLKTGDFGTGGFLLYMGAIPMALILAIYAVMLDIKSDEIAEKPCKDR